MSRFSLEHFYFGHPTSDNASVSKATVLAASAGISSALAKQAVERVRIPPTPAKDGSWALVRGKSRELPFLLVQTQQSANQTPISHYIVLSTDAIRAISGNILTFQRLIRTDFPTFDGGKTTKIKQLDIFAPPPLSTDHQVDMILELMTLTNNQIKVLEVLLSAIVQGVPIYITTPPTAQHERLSLIQGLVALLPTSARFGVTFALHSNEQTQVDVQIRFYDGTLSLDNKVIYDWATKQIISDITPDEYSRFVISQLRLDTALVIEHNAGMGSIAGWRLNQGDTLAQSLAYASKRVRIDSAINNNQPVNKEEVALILADDPTLSPELQNKYALHLLRLGIAMRDLSAAAPIAILLRGNDQLERTVLEELNNTLTPETSPFIYSTLLSWMNNPLGPQGFRWVDITHRAIIQHLQQLVDHHDTTSASQTLDELHNAGIALQLTELTPRLTKLMLPLSYEDAQLAEDLFLLGVRYLPNLSFQELMNVDKFRDQLNPQLARAWVGVIDRNTDSTTLDGETLLKASRQYGERWSAPILIRLCELALHHQHYAALDADIFQALYEIAKSPDGREYLVSLRLIARMVESEYLDRLSNPGPRYLLQVYLALGEYEALAKGLIRQVKLLQWDNEDHYLLMVRELFSQTQTPLSQINTLIEQLSVHGLRSAPYIVAMVTSAQPYAGEATIDPIIGQTVDALIETPTIAELLPPKTLFTLLDHYALRRDTDGMRRTLSILPTAIDGKGGIGIKLAAQAYRKSNWSEEARQISLDVLRASIRMQSEQNARKSIGYYTKELGASVQKPLQVTYLVHRMMGRQDIDTYSDTLHDAVKFLYRLASMYTAESIQPTASALAEALGTLAGAGGLRPKQQDVLLKRIRFNGQAILKLGGQYRAGKRNDESKQAQIMVAGKASPISIIDLMRMMSGGLADGNRIRLRIKPDPNLYPFQNYSIEELIGGFSALQKILHPFVNTLPLNKRVDINPSVIIAEMKSFYHAQADPSSLQDIARDWQYLADLIVLIHTTGDAKAFQDSALAKKLDERRQAPKSVLELMRFIYGYYLHVL